MMCQRNTGQFESIKVNSNELVMQLDAQYWINLSSDIDHEQHRLTATPLPPSLSLRSEQYMAAIPDYSLGSIRQ